MVSKFYHGYHKLIVHVRRGTGFYRLILYDLGIFQVLLDVQSLEKLKKLPILSFCFCLELTIIVEARFYNLQD